MIYKNKNQKGFVALFTVLLVSVILAMALGIASLSLKEIVLSSTASDGNKAFYAADSGIECALYLEKINPTSLPSINGSRCNNAVIQNFEPAARTTAAEAVEFTASFGEPENELCAFIKIERGFTGRPYLNQIESKGSNLPCGSEGDPKKVERSIRVTY